MRLSTPAAVPFSRATESASSDKSTATALASLQNAKKETAIAPLPVPKSSREMSGRLRYRSIIVSSHASVSGRGTKTCSFTVNESPMNSRFPTKTAAQNPATRF